jgi:hypothetical protein
MLELLKAYSPSGNEAEAIKRYVNVVSRWWNGDIVVDDAEMHYLITGEEKNGCF